MFIAQLHSALPGPKAPSSINTGGEGTPHRQQDTKRGEAAVREGFNINWERVGEFFIQSSRGSSTLWFREIDGEIDRRMDG